MIKPNTGFIFMDLETGGTDPKKHSVLTVAMATTVIDENGHRVDQPVWESRVKERNISVTREAFDINGLDPYAKDWNGADPRDVATSINHKLGELLEVCDKRDIYLVGHGIEFDVRFLRRLYSQQSAVELPKHLDGYHALCTHTIHSFLSMSDPGGTEKSQGNSLKTLVGFYGLGEDYEFHTAKDDCLAARDLFFALLDKREKEAADKQQTPYARE